MHPFGTGAGTTGQAGEAELLARLKDCLRAVTPPTPEGIGDDCATWRPPAGETLLLTTDPVVHGIHFDSSHSPAAVGAKLLKRNLSDIAAMGGRPGPALLALAMGADLRTAWLMPFMEGLAEACVKYAVPLVGGDVTAAADGTFAATLTQTGSATRPIPRTGATVDSTIWVTGRLGGSFASGRHLSFEPRLAEGQWLAGQDAVLAMTDLSDGLAKDLPGLLPEGTQAHIDPEAIPTAPDTSLGQALSDGEDYELLFTLAPGKQFDSWPFETPVHAIGQIVPGSPAGLLVNKTDGRPLGSVAGYEHFC